MKYHSRQTEFCRNIPIKFGNFSSALAIDQERRKEKSGVDVIVPGVLQASYPTECSSVEISSHCCTF